MISSRLGCAHARIIGFVALATIIVAFARTTEAGILRYKTAVAPNRQDSLPERRTQPLPTYKVSKLKLKLSPNLKTICGACNCAATDEAGFPRCLKGCLADVGVSPVTLILCGGTCAVGAVPLCALCMGVSVAVLEACTLGCAAYPNGVGFVEGSARNSTKRAERKNQVARLVPHLQLR